jgi:agmatinase
MNFGGNEVLYDYSGSGIIIVPVPYDETSTWIKGADRGPDAVMEASVNLEFYDIETGIEAHLHGIHTIAPVTAKGISLKSLLKLSSVRLRICSIMASFL